MRKLLPPLRDPQDGPEVDMRCGSCRWHKSHSWKCLQTESSQFDCFTDSEEVCEEWEARE